MMTVTRKYGLYAFLQTALCLSTPHQAAASMGGTVVHRSHIGKSELSRMEVTVHLHRRYLPCALDGITSNLMRPW